jgi:hypothetical protein
MPLGLIVRLRRCRRPAVMVAAGLVAVQAFLAGLTGAQALVLTANLSGPDFTVICHGTGGSGSDSRAAQDPAQDPAGPNPATTQHPCCEACAAAAAPATLPAQLTVVRTDRWRAFASPVLSAVLVRITPRAVRAGTSQAPPILG